MTATTITHVRAALAALETRDLAAARAAVAQARRALGHWGGRPLRTEADVTVSILADSRTERVAINLANAADALARGDVWPADAPDAVRAWLDTDDDEPAPHVAAWLVAHPLVETGLVGVSLRTALRELEEIPTSEEG